MSGDDRAFWDVPDDLAASGAWAAKRRLATALRALGTACVTTDAEEEALAYAAREVERIVKSLDGYSTRTFAQGIYACKGLDDLAVFADRGTMVGRCNPIAPPMVLSMEGDTAVAKVTFGPMFEGIPGHVHGGMLAAAFDQLFGYLQTKRASGALTAKLEVRYRKPTPMNTELRLEGMILERAGRRTTLSAKMMANGEVTAEADGIFVEIDGSKLRAVMAGA
jgi:acyl-coenzyme A thioesterase PaaI-like protein